MTDGTKTLAERIERLRDNCTDNKLWAGTHKECLGIIGKLEAENASLRHRLQTAQQRMIEADEAILFGEGYDRLRELVHATIEATDLGEGERPPHEIASGIGQATIDYRRKIITHHKELPE